MLKNERFCVGCCKLYNTNSLIKVKFSNEKIYINPNIYLDGRSAYLCYSQDCINKAQKTKKLERSFKGKAKITKDFWLFLEKEVLTSK
ncbi:MAG: YlxR family protein [Candidatus Sericytochromatia bacterium]